MRKFLANIAFRIFAYFIPEISILKKQVPWDYLRDYLVGTPVSDKCKISSPHQIYNSSIGDYTYIGTNAVMSRTDLGKFCSIGPNLFCGWGIHPTNGISTAPMFYSMQKQNGTTLCTSVKIDERKRITIGNDVFIGTNVTILDGITIGDGAVIGAGSVVSKDIPAYAIAVGAPIKVVKYRFNNNQIEKLLKIKWWDFNDDQLSDIEKMFFDIDDFIKKYDV